MSNRSNVAIPDAPLPGLASAGFPALQPLRNAIARFADGRDAVPNWLASALDQSACGILLCVNERVVYQNEAARRGAPLSTAGNAQHDASETVVVIPLTRRNLPDLDASLVIKGPAAVCDELAAHADHVLSEIEDFISCLGRVQEEDRALVTLMFTDIVESTACAERLGDAGWRLLLARHHAIVRRHLAAFRGTEVDAAGDGFFATFDAPARAVRCAQAIRADVRALGLEIRAGIHTGECEMAGRKVAGLAVHVAARVAETAAAGEILVSSTVKELAAGSNLAFGGGDWHSFKGVSDAWRLFSVESAGP